MGTNKQSKCMYCGANGYGVGCPYSPHKKHVHCDDPKRCIYCGSTSFGVGCPYNPFSKKHVHGVEFNQMMKESLHSNFTMGIFLSRLTDVITETAAYKLGLINEEGMKIKNPQTAEEKAALTPLDMYIFKIRRMLGEEKIKLLNTSIIIEALSNQLPQQFDAEQYEHEINLKIQVANIAKDFKNIITEGLQKGIPVSTIENMFIETIIGDEDK